MRHGEVGSLVVPDAGRGRGGCRGTRCIAITVGHAHADRTVQFIDIVILGRYRITHRALTDRQYHRVCTGGTVRDITGRITCLFHPQVKGQIHAGCRVRHQGKADRPALGCAIVGGNRDHRSINIGHRDCHILNHQRIRVVRSVTAGHDMTHHRRAPATRIIDVVTNAAHHHRLRLIPVERRKGQAVHRRCRNVRIGTAHANHYIGCRAGTEHQRVAGRAILGHRNAILIRCHADRTGIDNGDRQTDADRIATARHTMQQLKPAGRGIAIRHGRHLNGLRLLPVERGKYQSTAIQPHTRIHRHTDIKHRR